MKIKHYVKCNKLDECEGIISCGYMFKGYERRAYFWEFVKIYLRVTMLLAYEIIIKEVR